MRLSSRALKVDSCFWGILLMGWMLFWTAACQSTGRSPQPLRDLPFSYQASTDIDLMRVGSEDVSEAELRLIAREETAPVIDYYVRTYGVDDVNALWSQSFDGDVPDQRLLRRAIIKTAEHKIILLLSQQYGIRQDISMENLVRRCEVENLVRQETLEKGETVYGPEQYSLDEFFRQDTVSLRLALMQILEEKDLLRDYERNWLTGGQSSRRERMQQAFAGYLEAKLETAEISINEAALLAISVKP